MNDATPIAFLPKVRSTAITQSAKESPCSSRVSSLYPQYGCSGQDTNVWTHLGRLNKGMSSKVSDPNGCTSCFNCHDIIDGRDLMRRSYIMEKAPTAYMERLLEGVFESNARLKEAGIVTYKREEIIC